MEICGSIARDPKLQESCGCYRLNWQYAYVDVAIRRYIGEKACWESRFLLPLSSIVWRMPYASL